MALTHDMHRAVSMVADAVAHAARQKPLYAGKPPAADYDQITRLLLLRREADNALGGVPRLPAERISSAVRFAANLAASPAATEAALRAQSEPSLAARMCRNIIAASSPGVAAPRAPLALLLYRAV